MYGITKDPATPEANETAESQPETAAQTATVVPMIPRPVCPLCGEDMTGQKTHGKGATMVCWRCKFVDRRDV